MTDFDPLVLVLVAAVDRRVLPALALAPQFGDVEVRAVHVAMDAFAAQRLARDWMDLAITWPPLHIEEPTSPVLAECVYALVARERARAERRRITVLVPEMDLNRWWQPLLHRATGRSIAWALRGMANVTTAILPVAVELQDARVPAGEQLPRS